MIDVNWNDNAKAAVNAYNDWALENDLVIHAFFEHLTSNGHTQQKTVADAVAFCKKWNAKEFDYLFWHENIGFVYSQNREATLEYQFVCTRAEFEVYVKEQEGEKWTHTYGPSLKCRILATDDEHAWILTESGSKFTEYTENLKPIKPSLTKAEAWDLCQDYEGHKSMKKYMYDLHEQYDII